LEVDMTSKVRSDRWRGWVVLALGVCSSCPPGSWASPWSPPAAGAEEVAGGFTAAAWNAWIVGVAVAAFALWAALQSAAWPDWASGVLGAWLVLSPWILDFAAVTAALWNHVLVGVLIVALAVWDLWQVRHQPSQRTA
jgi:SPW repeat